MAITLKMNSTPIPTPEPKLLYPKLKEINLLKEVKTNFKEAQIVEHTRKELKNEKPKKKENQKKKKKMVLGNTY